MKEVRPKFFVMEPIPGIVCFQNGKIASQIWRVSRELEDSRILNAADYGAPQFRKRALFT